MSTWSIYCVTEEKFVNSASYTTTCPNNVSHNVNTGSIIQYPLDKYINTGPTGPSVNYSMNGVTDKYQVGTVQLSGKMFDYYLTGTGTYNTPFISDPIVTLDQSKGSANVSNITSSSFSASLNYNDFSSIRGTKLNTSTVFTNTQPSIYVVNGNPAVTYSSTANNLIYRRSTDSTGGVWSPEIIVGTGGSSITSSSLITLGNGNPAVAYINSTQTIFVSSQDTTGGVWNPQIILESVGNANAFYNLSMKLNSLGNPIVAYSTSSLGEIRIISSLNSNGSSWSTPVQVSVSTGTASNPSLQITNNNPSIFFSLTSAVSNNKLMYIRSNDNTGATWGSAVTIDGNIGSGFYVSSAIVAGNPAAVYYYNYNDSLRYIRSNDNTGASWNSSVSVSDLYIPQSSSITEYNSKPFVIFRSGDWYLSSSESADATGGSFYTKKNIDVLNNRSSVGYKAVTTLVNGEPAIIYYNTDSTNTVNIYYIRNSTTNSSVDYISVL